MNSWSHIKRLGAARCWWGAGILLFSSYACRDPESKGIQSVAAQKPVGFAAPEEAVGKEIPDVADQPAVAAPEATSPVAPPRALRRCFEDQPVWAEPALGDLLDQAATFFAAEDPEGALACAEEACRQSPRSIEAHHDRAAALLRVGRVEEARESVTMVLAISPTDLQALELAADIFINHLPPSSQRSLIGLEYLHRAQRSAGVRDRARLARLSLLEGQALIDLGHAQEALRPLERAAAAAQPSMAVSARYELGVALFELARFEEARQRFAAVLAAEPDNAHARFHYGLVLERAAEWALADEQLARASELDPAAFPRALDVSPAAFAEQVRQAVAALPVDVQQSLRDIPIEPAELPGLDDLIAESPPLSPTILGLYRGLPLGRVVTEDPSGRTKNGRVGRGRSPSIPGVTSAGSPAQYAVPERAIVLYRRNILRAVRNEAELTDAIYRTLLHEVGHLRGEDDGSLRDRGLE